MFQAEQITVDQGQSPVFSPDGKSVIYSEFGGELVGDVSAWFLKKYSLDTGDISTISGEIRSGDSAPGPAISPNGKVVAYTSGKIGSNEIRFLRLSDGKDWRFPSDFQARSGSFSPDGRWLAFLGYEDGNWDIFVSDIGGKRVKRLTDSPDREFAPRFSPDGTRIVFSRPYGPDPGSLTIYTLDSGQTTSLDVPGTPYPSEWTRAGLFRVSTCACRQRRLGVRVFNPGRIVVKGKGIRTVKRTIKKPGKYFIRPRWTGKRKRSLAHIQFKPSGALAVAKKRAIGK